MLTSIKELEEWIGKAVADAEYAKKSNPTKLIEAYWNGYIKCLNEMKASILKEGWVAPNEINDGRLAYNSSSNHMYRRSSSSDKRISFDDR